MKITGTILRIQRSRSGVTLIIETPMGLRGVELDRELWAQILTDFAQPDTATLTGWAVEYDPAHGDLDIIAPPDGDPESLDRRGDPDQPDRRRETDR
ncbi:MAG: hypothetical protein Kow00106_03400 [Anaerolineae bacterium]